MTYRLAIEPTQQDGQQLSLTAQQQHYLQRVLRLRPGDRFVALDGRGQSWIAQLGDPGAILLSPLSEARELSVPVTLMAALPKGGGFEDIVRGCTELGVTAIIPVISERTLLKPSPHKWERWRKIAAEAAEQSERQIIPAITQPMPWTEAIAAPDNAKSDCYLCVTRHPATHLLAYLKNRPSQPTVIATGPEGGWTEAEVEAAIALGFQPATLGCRILRSVTAPLAAISLVAAAIEQGIESK